MSPFNPKRKNIMKYHEAIEIVSDLKKGDRVGKLHEEAIRFIIDAEILHYKLLRNAYKVYNKKIKRLRQN